MTIAVESSSRHERRLGRTAVAAAVILLLAGAMFIGQVLTEDATPSAGPGTVQMTSGEAILIKDAFLGRQSTVSASATGKGNGHAILFKDSLQASPTGVTKSHAVAFAEKDRIESATPINR